MLEPFQYPAFCLEHGILLGLAEVDRGFAEPLLEAPRFSWPHYQFLWNFLGFFKQLNILRFPTALFLVDKVDIHEVLKKS